MEKIKYLLDNYRLTLKDQQCQLTRNVEVKSEINKTHRAY